MKINSNILKNIESLYKENPGYIEEILIAIINAPDMMSFAARALLGNEEAKQRFTLLADSLWDKYSKTDKGLKTEILKQKGDYILVKINHQDRVEYATYYQDSYGNRFFGDYTSDIEIAVNSLNRRSKL